jgi:hypothetical protein
MTSISGRPVGNHFSPLWRVCDRQAAGKHKGIDFAQLAILENVIQSSRVTGISRMVYRLFID